MAAEGAGGQMFAPFDNWFFPPARAGLGSVNLFFFSPARFAHEIYKSCKLFPPAAGRLAQLLSQSELSELISPTDLKRFEKNSSHITHHSSLTTKH